MKQRQRKRKFNFAHRVKTFRVTSEVADFMNSMGVSERASGILYACRARLHHKQRGAMSLPPLPDVKPYTYNMDLCYTTEQMQAYGQACRAAALEEAALFISGGSFLHDQSPVKMWANQLVPKIRSLK